MYCVYMNFCRVCYGPVGLKYKLSYLILSYLTSCLDRLLFSIGQPFKMFMIIVFSVSSDLFSILGLSNLFSIVHLHVLSVANR